MGTRHNVVFMGYEHEYEDEKGNKKIANQLNFAKTKKVYKKCLKDCPKVYVHWDGYPSGALPILKEFLNTEGARSRMHDPEYLSAYYISWKIIHDFGHTNLKQLDDFRSIGVETQLSTWADYTYIIKPEAKSHNNNKFVIYVLDYNLKLIAKIERLDDIDTFEQEQPEWWY